MKNLKNLLNILLIFLGLPLVIYLNIQALYSLSQPKTSLQAILSNFTYVLLAIIFVILPLYYLNTKRVNLQFFLNMLQKKGTENWKQILEEYNKELDDLRTYEFHQLGEFIYKNLFKKYISNFELSEEELQSLDEIFSYFQLSQDFIKKLQLKEGVPIIKELYDFSYDDHIFSEEEKLKVMKLASALDIHREEVERMGKEATLEAYRKTVAQIIDDNRFTEQEEKELEEAKSKLKLHSSDWEFLGQEQKLDIYKTIYRIEKGHFPEINPSFPLPKDEKAHFEKNATLLEYFPDEKYLKNRGYICKVKRGETYEVGKERKTNLSPTGKGRFDGNIFLTSKRILFLQKTRTFSISFDELYVIETFRNGVCLITPKKSYLLEFPNEDEIFTYILVKLWNRTKP